MIIKDDRLVALPARFIQTNERYDPSSVKPPIVFCGDHDFDEEGIQQVALINTETGECEAFTLVKTDNRLKKFDANP